MQDRNNTEPGSQVKLYLRFKQDSDLIDPYSIGDIEIWKDNVGIGRLYATLTPQKEKTGIYYVIWDVPSDQPTGQYVDYWKSIKYNISDTNIENIVNTFIVHDDNEGPSRSEEGQIFQDFVGNTGLIQVSNKNVQDPKFVDNNKYSQYSYQGYHRFTPREVLLTGEASPYSRTPTEKGLIVYKQHVQRLEMLLRTTGEWVTLWRRKWEGELCSCYDHRRGQARNRCPNCFGIGYIGGYDLYTNVFALPGYTPQRGDQKLYRDEYDGYGEQRDVDGYGTSVRVEDRPGEKDVFLDPYYPGGVRGGNNEIGEPYQQHKILMRIADTVDDLTLKNSGMHQNFVPAAWTLPVPFLRDRDVLIRYDDEGQEVWRYEVLTVTRNVGFFKGQLNGIDSKANNSLMLQKLTLHRFEKTDPIYKLGQTDITYESKYGESYKEGYGDGYGGTTTSNYEQYYQIGYQNGWSDFKRNNGYMPSRRAPESDLVGLYVVNGYKNGYNAGYSDSYSST